MTQRYLIISDLHLCDIEEHADGWKYYKSSRYCVDEAFADRIRSFQQDRPKECENDTLVLNGDVFDFDLVTEIPEDRGFRISWLERRAGLAPTEKKSQWKLSRILQYHQGFIKTLAQFLGNGGKLVYVIGNHDREMHFKVVQDHFVNAIKEEVQKNHLRWKEDSIIFEPWFFHVPGVLFAEHGNQYDPFTSYRSVLSPVIHNKGGEQLALPMGNLSNRCLLSQMGSFNPFSGDYIKNAFGYLAHWIRFYLFRNRSLVLNWLFGAVLVFFGLMKTRSEEAGEPGPDKKTLADLALRKGISEQQLQKLADLQSRPVSTRIFRVLRELWLDRVLITMGMTVVTVFLAFTSFPLWIKLVVPLLFFPACYLSYAFFASRETVFDVRKRTPLCAQAIAEIFSVPLVTFGHDHVPRMVELGGGASFANSGTWAPITEKKGSMALVPGYRNYVIVINEDNKSEVKFGSWV